jgi:hypothetical protein
MTGRERDEVMRWTCPGCHLEWYDRGQGFSGTRFSRCLGCGTDACEQTDSRPAFAPVELPRDPREPALA